MAYKSQDTLFQWGDGGSPEAFDNVAAVTGIDGPSLSVDAIETTDLDSSSKTFIANIPDGGEVTLELNYDPGATTHDKLNDYLDAGSVNNFQICFPNLDATTVGVSSINTTSEQVTTSTAHGLTAGQPFEFTASAMPTSSPQVAADTTYFADYIDADTFTAHITNQNAVDGASAIDFSDQGTSVSITRGTKFGFAAIVTGCTPAAQVNDKLTASVTLKVTGAVTRN